jgi:dUTPase
MFDVAVKNTSAAIVITAIEVNIMNGTSAQVWTKSGSYIGFETRMGNWTKITGKTTKSAFVVAVKVY